MSAVRRVLQDATWWLLDYAYAAYWQARALGSSARADSFRDGVKTPVVIVPGVYESWRFLQPLIEHVHDAGHPVHVLDFAHLNSGPVIQGGDQVIAYLDDHDLSDVIIVAHSKGGLVGKYVMSMPQGLDRVRAMLAVATPFSGSLYARYLLVPSLRMFSPRDKTILALTRDRAVNSRIVSVYGRFDPHIPGGSFLAGAKNVELEAGGHFRVLAHPRVFAELDVLLN